MLKYLNGVILPVLAVIGVVLKHSFGNSHMDKTVNLGDRLSIPCPLSSSGGSVQWLQNGEPIVLSTATTRRRQWDIFPDGTAALTITDVRHSDSGRWECREMAADGTVRNIARVLDLVVASLLPPGSPDDPFLELEGRRLVHQATVTAREPQHLSMACVVTGAVPPVRHVHWLLADSNLTSVSELFIEFSPEDEAYVSRSVLLLNVTRRLHRKELVCQVHHVTWLQAAAVSASLNVLYDPSFSISREPGFGFPIIEGTSVSLRCEVDANPPSDPLWVKDDGPLTIQQDHFGFLNFTSISRDHAGWYRCTTHHEFGLFASFGYFLNVRSSDLPAGLGQPMAEGCEPDGRPEVTAVNKSLMAIAGKAAFLAGQLCSAGRPLRVHWILRHLVLSPGDVRHPYVAYNMTETEIPNCYMSALEIRQVNPEDAGELLLIVKNAKGIADANFLINVTQASFSISTGCSSFKWCPYHVAFLLSLCLLELFRVIEDTAS